MTRFHSLKLRGSAVLIFCVRRRQKKADKLYPWSLNRAIPLIISKVIHAEIFFGFAINGTLRDWLKPGTSAQPIKSKAKPIATRLLTFLRARGFAYTSIIDVFLF